MNRQAYWRSRYKQLRPDWNASSVLYERLIAARLDPATRVLDLGCGHKGSPRAITEKTALVYGADPDLEALRENGAIRRRIAADAEHLPFRDASFNVVVLSWVMEHLDDPKRSFEEIHRVLKAGGSLVFLTPNTWNYNVWGIRLVPNALHEFLVRKLYGREERHSFPTRYRLNSVRRIERALGAIGFQRERLILNGDPSYISFNAALFRLACLLEGLLNRQSLERARVHIIGAYRRT
jgi:SAM-dependent methyltransferase